MAIANRDADSFTILLNSNGNFATTPPGTYSTPDIPLGIASDDFNADGKRDVVVSTNTNVMLMDDSVAVYINQSPPVGVEDGLPVMTPLALAVAPTPFSTTAFISYSLPVEADVVLDILDLSGRRVRALEIGRRPAGKHRVSWNGQDDGGRSVPAGAYFSRLLLGDRQITRKTVYIP